MEIGPLKNSRPIQPSADEPGNKATAVKKTPGPSDQIEISENARMKLAELADQANARQEEELGAVYTRPENKTVSQSREGPAIAKGGDRESRLDEVRRRMEDGFYDRPEIRKRIADNLSDEIMD